MDRAARFVGTTLLVAASGCAAPDERADFAVEPPEAFALSGEVALSERWWRAFGSEELDDLVARALRDNRELLAARERVLAARAVARRARAPMRPTLDAEAVADGRRTDVQFGGPDDESGIELGAAAEWELDLWGRLDAAAEREEALARATEADRRAAALSLSAEVVTAWLELCEARAQSALAAEQLATNDEVLGLIEVRFGTGQVRAVDILRQRELVEASRARRLQVDARRATLEHRLAVLLGRTPRTPGLSAADTLPPLPPLPTTGVPAALVQRRPDLAALRARIRAADRDLDRAIAERYPRLTLSASARTFEDGPAVLFEDWVQRIAANLFGPLVDGGRRRAEVERARAELRATFADYAQATLEAFREVEDALVLEARRTERLASLEEQLRLSGEAYARLRDSYLNGVGGYIEVLTARTAQQDLRRTVLRARLERLRSRVALHRALAGPLPEDGPDDRPERRPDDGRGTPAAGAEADA